MILKIMIIVLFCFVLFLNTVSASSSRKLGREQKKKKGSTFRAIITRLETLAKQATVSFHNVEFELSTSPFIMGLSSPERGITSTFPKSSSLVFYRVNIKSDDIQAYAQERNMRFFKINLRLPE